jgi:beta-lactamase class A
MRSSPTPRRGGFPVLEVAGLLLILAATLLFMRELSRFSEERQEMSQGLVLGDVPVSGMTRAEAQAYVEQVYGAPVTVMLQGQEIRLNPEEVGFKVDSEAMLSRAGTDETFWSGFWDYLWRRPEQPKRIDLIASYSDELLKGWVADVAARYDAPATSAGSRLDTLSFNEGQAGFVLDQEGAVEALDEALMRPVNRTVGFSIEQTDVERPGMDTLSDLLVDYLEGQKYRGVASIYLVDEVTGDQMSLDVDLRGGTPEMVDCDIPYAGLSTMKIPLTEEYFRWLVDIYPYEFDVIEATLTESSNLNANFMLRDIGGGDMFAGTQVVNASMQYLGLENTFMVAPYDEEDPPEYYSTPAREAVRNGECINTNPDPYMQTTAEDLMMMLDMVYQCMAFDGGGLIAAYPGDVKQSECEMMIDVMQQNDEGKLILAGVPEDVEVAHKHGYTYDTISDAGVVLSPGGDYVLVIFLWQDVSWIAGTAFPIMEGISTAVFNYFNPDMINVPRQGYGDVLTPVETVAPDTE